MSEFVLRARRNPYFLVGLVALALMMIAHVANVNSSLTGFVPRLQWQMISGFLMVMILGFQWGLFFYKLSNNTFAVRRNRSLHKYTGIAFMIIFATHADTFGHTWMLLLTIVLLALLISGLFNREIIAYRPQWLYRTWLWFHVALAAVLMPMVVVHAMVAMMFE